MVTSASASASTPRPRPFSVLKRNPTYAPLSTSHLNTFSTLTDLDEILDYTNPNSALSKLLIPRAAGSQNLTTLQTYLVDFFTDLGWHVEQDRFTAKTPIGDKRFNNLVITHDPHATRRFVFAAHLDSKYFPTHPDDQFIGATDSAAPCAMLMDLAKSLTPWLDARKKRILAQGGEEGRSTQAETLQIIFFDGEEAFVDWTYDDSIYGARHLAKKWSQPSTRPSAIENVPRTEMQRISHFVLLDLLGALNPYCRSFYGPTGWLYDEFVNVEKKLGEAGILWPGHKGKGYARVAMADAENNPMKSFFMPRSSFGFMVEDDHIPFLEAGVPVVHMISVPFPTVWHTMLDNVDALHLPTIKAWALIIRLVTVEYLGLDPQGGSTTVKGKTPPDEDKAKRRNELVSPIERPRSWSVRHLTIRDAN
ncbi:BQ2448_5623 [Microbotryum intermedium]|uniref:Peptide hydrolase n=1 Tax=Microbotryum intermedium TaxID=269621 RepID=A0A238F1Q8_9BASI|nr:BQ2448_5623 [Microbotryum intermedium]